MRTILAVSALVGLAGCAAVRSDPINLSQHASRSGLQYSAPKGLFAVELIAQSGGGVSLEVSEPFYVGDPDASYSLDGASGALASQRYLIVVDPDTRLLSYINSRSEGQGGVIFRNLIRSASGVAAASRGGPGDESSVDQGEGDRVIFRRIVDPFTYDGCDFGATCDFRALNAQLREAALDYLNCADGGLKPALCERIRDDQNYFNLSLTPMFDASGAARAAQPTAAECRRSICYRAPAPYQMSLKVAGRADIAEMVTLPNEAPVMSLPIPAGVFATSRARVEMYDGMPARYTIDRDNELVAVTLLPFQLVEEGFRAASQVFQFRVNYNSDRVRQLDSELNRQAAEDRYRDAQERRRPSQQTLSEPSGASLGDFDGDNATGGEESSALTDPTEDDTGFNSNAEDVSTLRGEQRVVTQRALFRVQLGGEQ